MEYLKEETGADVFMIGVQPEGSPTVKSLSPGLESVVTRAGRDDRSDALKK